jgi:hypothetical protein
LGITVIFKNVIQEETNRNFISSNSCHHWVRNIFFSIWKINNYVWETRNFARDFAWMRILVFEKRVLKGIIGPSTNEVTGVLW